MRVSTEALKSVLQAKGLTDAEIDEILALASSQSRTRRARLVAVRKMDSESLEKFRQEQMLRELERMMRKQSSVDFQVASVMLSPTRTLAAFRSDDEVIVMELWHSASYRVPYNRRLMFQRLPKVKAEKLELTKLVVSTPQGLRVLTTGTGTRGVRITEEDRKWFIRSLNGTVLVRYGKWQVGLPKSDWKQILIAWRLRYPVIVQRWDGIEVSADGTRWFRVAELIPERSH